VPRLLDYAGAGSRLAPSAGLALDPSRWAWQVKVDGVYARISTDRAGRIATMLHRSGAPVAVADAGGLYGLATGMPDAVLHAELEAGTEAGRRAAASRGWVAAHLFDCSRLLGRNVASLPYSDRYGRLLRWQAQVECDGTLSRDDWWQLDEQGDAHDPATGRYCRAVPRDLRRLPVVELARGVGAGQRLWQSAVDREGGEGLVAVRLDAQLGVRGAKRKIKATDTIDAAVVAVFGRVATCSYAGVMFSLRVGSSAVRVGEVVEVAHDGWYESSTTPRFARLVRRRPDLGPV
jgi:hypothetical protein